jgi:hypothetical protein
VAYERFRPGICLEKRKLYSAGQCRRSPGRPRDYEATEPFGRLRLKCDGTRAETRFLLSAKRTSPYKSAGASVQSTTGSRGVRISGNNAGYTIFRGSVKSTGYPINSPVSPSLPLPCVTVCHHISTGLYESIQTTCLQLKISACTFVRPFAFVCVPTRRSD